MSLYRDNASIETFDSRHLVPVVATCALLTSEEAPPTHTLSTLLVEEDNVITAASSTDTLGYRSTEFLSTHVQHTSRSVYAAHQSSLMPYIHALFHGYSSVIVTSGTNRSKSLLYHGEGGGLLSLLSHDLVTSVQDAMLIEKASGDVDAIKGETGPIFSLALHAVMVTAEGGYTSPSPSPSPLNQHSYKTPMLEMTLDPSQLGNLAEVVMEIEQGLRSARTWYEEQRDDVSPLLLAIRVTRHAPSPTSPPLPPCSLVLVDPGTFANTTPTSRLHHLALERLVLAASKEEPLIYRGTLLLEALGSWLSNAYVLFSILGVLCVHESSNAVMEEEQGVALGLVRSIAALQGIEPKRRITMTRLTTPTKQAKAVEPVAPSSNTHAAASSSSPMRPVRVSRVSIQHSQLEVLEGVVATRVVRGKDRAPSPTPLPALLPLVPARGGMLKPIYYNHELELNAHVMRDVVEPDGLDAVLEEDEGDEMEVGVMMHRLVDNAAVPPKSNLLRMSAPMRPAWRDPKPKEKKLDAVSTRLAKQRAYTEQVRRSLPIYLNKTKGNKNAFSPAPVTAAIRVSPLSSGKQTPMEDKVEPVDLEEDEFDRAAEAALKRGQEALMRTLAGERALQGDL